MENGIQLQEILPFLIPLVILQVVLVTLGLFLLEGGLIGKRHFVTAAPGEQFLLKQCLHARRSWTPTKDRSP